MTDADQPRRDKRCLWHMRTAKDQVSAFAFCTTKYGRGNLQVLYTETVNRLPRLIARCESLLYADTVSHILCDEVKIILFTSTILREPALRYLAHITRL